MNCYIYIVRHGQSELNRDGKASGHSNPALTDDGRHQAQETKAALAAIHFDEAYSSDLQRAADTAMIIYGKPLPKSHQLAALRERNFGQLEGQPHTYLEKVHRELLKLAPSDQPHFRYAPDAESDHELSERFLGAIRFIGNKHPGKTVLVAAHGGCVRTMLVALGYAKSAELPPGSISNAGYVELLYDGKRLQVRQTAGVHRHIA